jgi:hypothetical protein
MAGTINAANLSIGFDASKLKGGIGGTRKEIQALAKLMTVAETDAQKYAKALDLLENAYMKGAITAQAYSAALERVAAAHGIETSSARNARIEAEKLAAANEMAAKQAAQQEHLRKLRHNSFLMEYEERKRLHAVNQRLAGMPMYSSGGGGGAFGAMIVGAAAVASLRSLNNEFRETANHIDAVGDKAASLGMSFNDLTLAQRFLGETSGLGPDAINSAIQKMQINLVEARKGTGDLANMLRRMGLDADKLSRMAPMEAIKAVANEFQRIDSAAERTAFAMDLFGKSGVQLAGALAQGADGAEEMRQHLEAAGVFVSGEAYNAIGLMNDQFERMDDHIQGVSNTITTKLAPAVAGLLLVMNKGLDAAGKSGFGQMQSMALTKFLDYQTFGGFSALTGIGEAAAKGAEKEKVEQAALEAAAEEEKIRQKSLEEQEKMWKDSDKRLREAKQKSLEKEMRDKQDAEQKKAKEEEAARVERLREANKWAKKTMTDEESIMQELWDIQNAVKEEFIAPEHASGLVMDMAKKDTNSNFISNIVPAMKEGSAEAYKFINKQNDEKKRHADVMRKYSEMVEKLNEIARKEIIALGVAR